MHATVQKWGNSLATRIPAPFAAQLHIDNGSEVEIRLDGQSIVITPAKPRYSLDELLAGITPENLHSETDWGHAVGNEVFE